MRYLIIFLLLISSAKAQIPAGVFNQGDDAMIVEVRVSAATGLAASIYPSGTANIEVDWGDGQSETFTTSGTKSHTYASAGTYMIKITGAMTGWGNSSTANKNKVYAIKSWGNLGLVTLAQACQNMVNIEHVAQIPTTVTTTNAMFFNATNFNGDISGWNMGNVTNMNIMFALASSFNGDISGWDVSNVTSMRGTFQAASSFNSDISGWNVSNVTDMISMFRDATSFNQDLSGWCVINLAVAPADFSLNTPSWTLPKPVWGTCP